MASRLTYMHFHLHDWNLARSNDTFYHLLTGSIVVSVEVVVLDKLIAITHDIILVLANKEVMLAMYFSLSRLSCCMRGFLSQNFGMLFHQHCYQRSLTNTAGSRNDDRTTVFWQKSLFAVHTFFVTIGDLLFSFDVVPEYIVDLVGPFDFVKG